MHFHDETNGDARKIPGNFPVKEIKFSHEILYPVSALSYELLDPRGLKINRIVVQRFAYTYSYDVGTVAIDGTLPR